MSNPKISAAINTYNEERDLPFALRSVAPWVDEIIVVDMHSTDRTREIAKEFGAKVFLHDNVGFADPARAFALSQCQGEWILILDADEMIPKSLSDWLLNAAKTNQGDVFRIARENFFFGEIMRYTRTGPDTDRHMRFFRRESIQLTDRIHSFLHPAPNARIVDVPYEDGKAIVHFCYTDISELLERINRYTTIEAEQAIKRGAKSKTSLRRALLAFWRYYIRGHGFKDGWRGFYYSLFVGFYHLAIAAKIQERKAVGGRDAVIAKYKTTIETILSAYKKRDKTEKRIGEKISVAINTYNEERNLPNVLRSVQSWAEEIVVVDMHSTDRTREIAESFGARVFLHEHLGFADPARAFALSQCTGDWILILDADEVVPEPLSRKLQAVAESSEADVINIPMENYLFGEILKFSSSGAGRIWHPRFFRAGSMQASGRLHPFLHSAEGSRITKLPYRSGEAIVHFAYADVSELIDKINRYTSIESAQAKGREGRTSPFRAIRRAMRTFWRHYIRDRGWQGGWRGFYYSAFLMMYEIAVMAKLKEKQTVGSVEKVIELYQNKAEKLLSDYPSPLPIRQGGGVLL